MASSAPSVSFFLSALLFAFCGLYQFGAVVVMFIMMYADLSGKYSSSLKSSPKSVLSIPLLSELSHAFSRR